MKTEKQFEITKSRSRKWRVPKNLALFPFVNDGWFQNYIDRQMVEDGDMNEGEEWSDD